MSPGKSGLCLYSLGRSWPRICVRSAACVCVRLRQSLHPHDLNSPGQPAPDGVDNGSTASTPGRDSSQRFAAAAAASAAAAAQFAYKRHHARLAPRSVENAEQSAVTVAEANSVAASSVIEPELARNSGRLEDVERERNDLYLRVV